jgi:hypothetical protein
LSTRLTIAGFALVSVAVLGIGATTASADDEPGPPESAGVPVNEFATEFHGCAGPLRSAIANGTLAGVTVGDLTIPDGFGQSFNPGGHVGSTDELAFLMDAIGLDLSQIQALCATLA